MSQYHSLLSSPATQISCFPSAQVKMRVVLFVSLATLAGIQLVQSQLIGVSAPADKCDFPDDFEVRNCGYKNQEDCEDKNCCWNPTAAFKCYHPKDPCAFETNCFPGSTCTNIEPLGDGMFECACSPVSNREDCRTRQGFCDIDPDDRIACGLVNHNPQPDFDGTPKEACEARGCCYNNATIGVKWCFHPQFKMVKWVS